ncbi:DUF4198 domain-containing protein [Sulfurivermis fontis]|uniref:DUF4198 domain-containing protein n=1 Tax=Sulfurivermis fontis TaxID=1972068 RepID=UPI00155851EC|nr:DUF4198 domain-containing protein [Sulfurivermis fontis]
MGGGIAVAGAHDLWLERSDDGYTLYYGHLHAGHDGQHYIEYSPAQVQWARCLAADGGERAAPPAESYPYRLHGCAGAFVQTSSGYWSKTPYGSKNLARDEAGAMVVKSWLSFESVKRLDAWGTALAGAFGRGLELLPLSDPRALKPGDKLRLRVVFDGQPLAGATVAYEGEPRGVSGDDGTVNIRLRHGGFQAVEASWSRPLASPKADEEVHATALNFETAPQ